jgi:hypothetical protein
MAWFGSWSLKISFRLHRSNTATIAAAAISPHAAPTSRVPAANCHCVAAAPCSRIVAAFTPQRWLFPCLPPSYVAQNSQFGGAFPHCRRSFRRQFSQLRQI